MSKQISFFINIIIIFLLLSEIIYTAEVSIIPLKKPLLKTDQFIKIKIFHNDEWARNRFKVLGYDKRKLPQSSMKSKNKVSTKS